MRLRVFTAGDMQSAMAQVRVALGENAVIISTASDKAKGKVTVTAAIEEEEPLVPLKAVAARPQAAQDPRNTEDGEWLDDLSMLLRYHGTPETLAGRLLYKARHMELEKLFALQKMQARESRHLLETNALTRLLSSFFRFAPIAITPSASPLRLMLIGPPGIGKTLAIAKLAAQLVMDRTRVTVVTTDNKRAGGIEQLAAFTDILELRLNVAETPEQLAKLLKGLQPDDALLIDSAGCNPYEKADLEELDTYIGLGGFEPVLTLPAGIDSFEAADTARAFSWPHVKRLLVTRADTSRRFGSVLAAADAKNLALANVSSSSRVVGELKPLDASSLAQLMLQYRLQSA